MTTENVILLTPVLGTAQCQSFTCESLLAQAKQTLCIEDYEELLLSILDAAYYSDADEEIQSIVDCYYSLVR
jgi:hypothetical protein